jgi:anaerobic C4-dicarboxylate transporter
MKSKLRSAGFVALVLAGLSWLAETAFYGDIDANGVVQESFFLPLTFILAALGIVLLLASLLVKSRQ